MRLDSYSIYNIVSYNHVYRLKNILKHVIICEGKSSIHQCVKSSDLSQCFECVKVCHSWILIKPL